MNNYAENTKLLETLSVDFCDLPHCAPLLVAARDKLTFFFLNSRHLWVEVVGFGAVDEFSRRCMTRAVVDMWWVVAIVRAREEGHRSKANCFSEWNSIMTDGSRGGRFQWIYRSRSLRNCTRLFETTGLSFFALQPWSAQSDWFASQIPTLIPPLFHVIFKVIRNQTLQPTNTKPQTAASQLQTRWFHSLPDPDSSTHQKIINPLSFRRCVGLRCYR